MASLGEVMAEIQQGMELARQGRSTFQQAVAEATDAAGLARATVRGSAHPEIQKAAKLLTEAEREAGTALARFERAALGAEAYLRILE